MSSTNITNEVFINNIINNEFVEITEQLRVINSNNPTVLVNQTGDKDFLDIKNNNNNILKIINNGNVGIGTINPNKKLDVNGDINLLGDIYLNNQIINTTNIIEGSNLYYTDERVDSNILSKNLVSFNSIPDNNSILYYNNNNWLNLKFDTDTLEITNDNKLKVIGGVSSGNNNSFNSTNITINDHSITPTYTEERIYPPIRNLLSANHIISGQNYGNGVYNTWESTTYNSNWSGYSAFKTSNGYYGSRYQYSTTTGLYNKSQYIVSDYKGDWVKIQLPIKIKLSKYGFKQRSTYVNRLPGEYKIYGSNDGINWVVLFHKTSNPTYLNGYFEESITTTETYDYFGLVVNKLNGNYDALNFDEWYIYGKEELLKSKSIYEIQDTVTEYSILETDSTNLITHWKFDNSIALFENSAPNPISLTLTPRTTISNDGIYSTTDKILGNGSLYKNDSDHTTGYLITPANWLTQIFNTTKQVSFAFWVKSTNTTNPNTIEHIFRQDSSFIIRQYVDTIDVFVSPNSWNSVDYVASATFTSNTWIHITIVIDLRTGISNNDAIKIYQNGEELTTSSIGSYTSMIGASSIDNTDDFKFLGGSSENNGFKGYLDDFRIYDKVLTETEIVYLANNMILNPDYKILTFVYDNQNDISGQTTYTISFENPTECDIVLIGGGGGGGGSAENTKGSGGGGAGEYQINSTTLLANTTYTIKVGKGGSGGIGNSSVVAGNNGITTVFSEKSTILYEAIGGGGGAGGKLNTITNGLGGACGGGATYQGIVGVGTKGYDGGIGDLNYFGGGGGGMGSVGNSATTFGGGNGGNGIIMDITGISIEVSGGGGGGGYTEDFETYSKRGGGNGVYGGGNGGGYQTFITGNSYNGINATNYGSGGGGATIGGTGSGDKNGGDGGPGMIIIKYKSNIKAENNTLNQLLSALSSLPPDEHSLMYFDTTNTLNSLKIDTNSLEITSNNKLKVISNAGNINGIDDSSSTILEISKHIIPETNSIYDIGSAEKKIRHLFLSDNSLWIGDENKISITEGKMKIRKRKRNIIPSKLLELDPTINETKLLEIINTNELIQKQTLNELTLNDWEKYLKIKYPQNNLFVTDLFESTTDYDLDATTDAWIESMNKNIIINNYYNNIGIGVENPNKKIDINGDINLTGSIYVNYEQISTNDIVEGENKYYTEDRVNSNIASKNLININNIPNDKDILYYKDGNWTNLKLDQNSLEISNDHKLKIIDNLLNKIQSLEDRIISLESK